MTDSVPQERGTELLREMMLLRRFEERCAELYSAGWIRGFLHLYVGEEAIAAGAMGALSPEDNVISTYREHGHAIARGVPPAEVMAELYGKVEGVSRGRGGSMHMFSAERRFYGGHAIVAGGLPVGIGLALADALRGDRRVTACLFGDGAMAEGAFHESANLAALWKLPVLFICENNFYAMGTHLSRSHAETNLARKAESHRVPSEVVDGMDVLAVEATVSRAAQSVREGAGPRFLECQTYRYRAHSMYDPDRYRSKDEIEDWKRRDPIDRLRSRLCAEHLLGEDDVRALEADVEAEVDSAVRFAESGRLESPQDLLLDVTGPSRAS